MGTPIGRPEPNPSWDLIDDPRVVDILRREVEAHPEWADIQNQWGLCLLVTGRHEAAVDTFQRALDINPRYAWAALNQAAARFLCGQRNRARAQLESAPDPGSTAKILSAAWMDLRSNNPRAASTRLQEIQDTDRADVLRLQAAIAAVSDESSAESTREALMAESVPPPSRKLARRALAKDSEVAAFPGICQLWQAASRIQARLGNSDDAQNSAEVANLYFSDRGRYLTHAGFLAMILGNDDEAVRCYEEATRVAETDPTGPAALARHWASRGNLAKARAYLETALSRAPRYADLVRLMGHLQSADGDHAGALANFRFALEINPRYQLALIDQAIALFHMGCWEEADAAYRNVLTEGIRSADILTHHARCLEHLGKLGEAKSVYLQALEMNETEPAAHYRLAILGRRLGDGDCDDHWDRLASICGTLGAAEIMELIPDWECFEDPDHPVPTPNRKVS